MLCRVCNKEIEDDSVFCVECGARVDGNKVCANCGTLNAEDKEICCKCGARLDGKEYCKNCGALLNGEYCEDCGCKKGQVKSQSANITQTTQKTKTTAFEKFKNVEKYLTPSVLLFAIVILFCFSFGVGISIDATNGGKDLTTAAGVVPRSGGGALYFFTQSFIETRDFISAHTGNPNYNIVMAGMQMSNVVSLLAIAVNFGIIATMFIKCAIKIGVCMKNGERANVYKYALTAFVSFFVSATIVKMSNYVCIEQYNSSAWSSTFYSVSMSAGSVFGIFFSIGPLLLGFILTQIIKGKEFATYKNLAKVIPLGIITIVLVFALGLVGEVVIIETQNTTYCEKSIATVMASTFFSALQSPYPNDLSATVVFYAIEYIFNIIEIISVGALLRVVLGAMFGEKTNKKPILILAIVSLALSVVVGLCPLVFYLAQSGITERAIGLGSTASFVALLLVLVGTITYVCLNKEIKETEKTE